jgi:hypothetical protein
VAKTFADAEGVQIAYSGPFGSVTYEAARHIHSEPTRASADVVSASGNAVSKSVMSYFTGAALLNWVKGDAATKQAQETTTRHGAEQATARAANDNATAVSLAEIEAGL